jgi:hypothetical protein
MLKSFRGLRKFSEVRRVSLESASKIPSHHEAHEGHEGSENDPLESINFVLFVTFVVMSIFSFLIAALPR